MLFLYYNIVYMAIRLLNYLITVLGICVHL